MGKGKVMDGRNQEGNVVPLVVLGIGTKQQTITVWAELSGNLIFKQPHILNASSQLQDKPWDPNNNKN